MRIDDIIQQKGRDVVTATPEMSIVQAAQLLHQHRIGLLVVCGESGKVIGVISERDIVRGVAAQPERISEMTVNELATTDVATCELDDHPETVLRRMNEMGVRHMPVIQYGHLKGLISNRDLFRFLIEETDANEKASLYSEFSYL